MKKYDSYKDSGVKWLGQIPSHWEVLPGLAVVKENKEKNSKLEFNTVLSLSYGNIIIKKDINEGLVPAEYNTYQIVKPGYIIIRCTDLQNDKTSLRTGLVKNEGIITSAYLGLVVDRKYNAPYIHYFLHTWDITKEIYRHGSGLRQSLSWLDLKRLPILLPPIAEQDAIVTYLDTATAKIDAAILQQQKMIDLLKERKQIIINSAVTRGLDKNVKMKDSGVEWIGMIPETWECRKLKYIVTYNDESLSENENKDLKIKYIEIGDVDSVEGVKNYTEYVFKDAPSRARRITKKGDVIVSTVRTYLRAIAPIEDENLIVSTGFAVLRARNMINNEFLAFSLMSDGFVNKVISKSVGTSYPAINSSDLLDIKIAYPTFEIQKLIVSYLNEDMQKINQMVANCNKQIALLQERKQIIINDVVTGKVKVG